MVKADINLSLLSKSTIYLQQLVHDKQGFKSRVPARIACTDQ